MNEYDSQRIFQLLHKDYEIAYSPEDADLIIINTCSIREKAENKLYSLAGRYRPLKKHKPDLVIGIGGCVAQQEGEKLLERMSYVDLVFGPQAIYNLPELIYKVVNYGERSVDVSQNRNFAIPQIDLPLPEKNPVRAFVTIMQGCDNFCAYCVVPYVRGREISRPAKDIVEEVKSAVRQGAKDITLLGQNVNSYGAKKSDFPCFSELLDMVNDIKGLERLRFTTSHPKDLSDELVSKFGKLATLCEHLHLPVQSGSSNVLRLMNRKYTREDYLEKIGKLREICPSITITTDIITGFPGETDQDFNDTLSLLETVRYDQIFAFKYSKRPNTKAIELEGHLPEDVKSSRLSQILELQTEIGLSQYKKMEGQTVETLVESGENHVKVEGKLRGRSRGNHVINFYGDQRLVGSTVKVFIEKACNHSLLGKLMP